MTGGAWLLMTAGLLIAALALRQTPLLLVALLFFLSSGLARLWARYSLRRVTYSRRLGATHVTFGDTVTMDISVENRKLLPIPSMQIQDEVPAEVEFMRGGEVSASPVLSRSILSCHLSLGWYHRITRRYTLRCTNRGHFAFGPARIRSGDLFGFFTNEMYIEGVDHLTVYPRVVPLEELGIPSRYPFGDLRVRRHLFEDPVRAVSTRDYAPRDPLKRIHWRATARVGRLQSRVFEPTTTVDLALFLDVRTVEPPLHGLVEQLLETAIIAVASIASYALDAGYRVGVYVNESNRGMERVMSFPPSDHPDQLQRLLEALAQVRGQALAPMEELLSGQARALAWDATVVAVSATPNDALLDSLARLRRGGRRVALVVVGTPVNPVRTEGMTVYQVLDQVGQVGWRDRTAVSLAQPRRCEI